MGALLCAPHIAAPLAVNVGRTAVQY
jgi:hypothetical protein